MAGSSYYNIYTKKPVTAAQYSMMRGVTDFTNAEQLNMFEKGHGMIIIINRPAFIEKLIEKEGENINSDAKQLLDTFCNIVEYEFRGLDGIEDITAEDLTYTDGISELAGVGKVNEQSNSEVTMRFTEKSGSAITKFIKFYLNGVRDSRTQTKHYYGLIADGSVRMGFENEVFNLLYLVTDASGLALEAAYLLANAWPNAARTNIYNIEKGSIESAEIDVTWKCFVLQNEEIDKRALRMLAYINKDFGSSSNPSNNDIKNPVAGAAHGNQDDAAKAIANQQMDHDKGHEIEWNSQKYNYKGISGIEKRYTNNSTTTE